MQITINIKNESIADKIIWFLDSFRDKGVEVINHGTEKGDKNRELSDTYIKKHWRELIITNVDNSDYYKSDQYMIDRAVDWEERGKA